LVFAIAIRHNVSDRLIPPTPVNKSSEKRRDELQEGGEVIFDEKL